jgi:hypothetical protein
MSDDQEQSPPPSNLPSTDSAGKAAAPAGESIPNETLKAAYVAFKKRWKLTRLDYESRIGRGPLSSGSRSAIVGIEGPRDYPRAVWEELVKQGRLKHAGSGLYSMP